MTCDRIEHLLSAHLDGELGADDERAVRSHLAACPSCASRLETLRALRASFRDLMPEPSDDGLDAVLARILPATARRPRPRWPTTRSRSLPLPGRRPRRRVEATGGSPASRRR